MSDREQVVEGKMKWKDRKRMIVRRLFEQNKFCKYCKAEMVMPNHVRHKTDPPNMVTYEHRRSKINPERGTGPRGKRINGICCKACNEAQGREDELKFLGIEGIRERAKHGKVQPPSPMRDNTQQR